VKSVDVMGERRSRVMHKPNPLRSPRELELKQLDAEAPHRLVSRQEDAAAVFNVEDRLEPTQTGTRFTQVSEFAWKRLPPDTSRDVRTGCTPGGKRTASDVKGAPRTRRAARRLMP
jgi:hypothetical protein